MQETRWIGKQKEKANWELIAGSEATAPEIGYDLKCLLEMSQAKYSGNPEPVRPSWAGGIIAPGSQDKGVPCCIPCRHGRWTTLVSGCLRWQKLGRSLGWSLPLLPRKVLSTRLALPHRSHFVMQWNQYFPFEYFKTYQHTQKIQ